MKRVLSVLAVTALCGIPASASAGVIVDFQDVVSGRCAYAGPSVSSQGFTFTGNPTDPSMFICDANVLAQNTSAALINANLTSQVFMTQTGGGTFSLSSFFAGTRTEDYNTSIESRNYGTATGIQVIGNLLGGGTVQTSVALNGLQFGQFVLPNTFVNLTQVSFLALGASRGTGPEFVIDDIAVNQTAVPEPASLVLLGSGLLGSLAAARRRRRDQNVQ